MTSKKITVQYFTAKIFTVQYITVNYSADICIDIHKYGLAKGGSNLLVIAYFHHCILYSKEYHYHTSSRHPILFLVYLGLLFWKRSFKLRSLGCTLAEVSNFCAKACKPLSPPPRIFVFCASSWDEIRWGLPYLKGMAIYVWKEIRMRERNNYEDYFWTVMP